MKLLHIYAQDSWHQPVTIVGNREALEQLVEHLQLLLNDGQQGQSFEAFVNDGEGYDVRLLMIEHPDTWERIATPYTDEMCQGTNEGKVYP